MKLIAIDMDGTLLNDNNSISKAQCEYLIDLSNKDDCEIVISTGRLVDGIKNLLPKELYDLVYIIALNGGIVLGKDKSLIYMETLGEIEINHIFDVFKDYHEDFSILDEEFYYRFTETNNVYMDYEEELNKIKIIETSRDQIKNYNVLKTVLFLNPENREIIENTLVSLDKTNINTIFSQPYLLEFLPKSVHKGSALRILAENLKIQMKDTVAIGDGSNDITLMEMAGISIAMGNAIDEIKEISDYISESNNSDGVMKGLKKYLFKE